MLLRIIATALAIGASIAFGSSKARAEPRLALVIGQGAYATGELPTAVNDAGLVGQTLTSAGFEVVQGRDLNQADLRRIIRDFLDGVQTATADTSVVVYFAGHALQVEGENYILPIDARIGRESDIPIEGYRVSDIMRSLSATPGASRMVIVDAAQEYPLPRGGQGIARGLTLIEPPASFLVAFSAAPGTVGPAPQPPYGPYATALIEMMREPGITPDDLFSRVRLRVHEATQGRQIPWHTANLSAPFTFFEPVDATAAAPRPAPRRIASLPPEEAYAIAVERDTIEAYQEFLRTYPDHPLSRRVKVLLAARREALIWRRTVLRNTPEAYWTYLSRYPQGPHAADARRRLTRLSAPVAPPPDFDEVSYGDLPPPLPVETYVVRETIYLDDLPPPPRAPVYLLPERDEEIVRLAAPPPSPGPGILPIPIPIPIPGRARPPAEFRPPIAPITPQGPVTIPVVAPPVQGQARPAEQGGAARGGQPGAFSQTGQPSAPSAQPGLRGPITPLAQQPQPEQSGAAAGAQPSAPASPSLVAPAETRPGRPPGTPPSQAPTARPGAIVPTTPGTQPGTASRTSPPAQPARAGAIPTAPGGAPGTATSPPTPPQPGAPPTARPAATAPTTRTPASPPQSTASGQVPTGAPAARAPAQGASQSRPSAATQSPRPTAPAQGSSASAPGQAGARPASARVQSPADRGLPPELQGRGRLAVPGGQRSTAPPIHRPAAPAVAQPPRPAGPPAAAAAPRPAGPPPSPSPTAQAPRPPGPPPGAAAGPRPGGPPPGAQGGGAAKPSGLGGPQKCVLPARRPPVI
jgi:uncharacterized caspase-like protein